MPVKGMRMEKQKKKYAGHELTGKSLGVIGCGAIGIQVANLALRFGMKVYGYDPYMSVDAAWNLSRYVNQFYPLLATFTYTSSPFFVYYTHCFSQSPTILYTFVHFC